MAAASAWTQPADLSRIESSNQRLHVSPGLHAGWIEDRRTFARASRPGTTRRRRLDRAWSRIGFDAHGNGLTVTTYTSRRPCRGKRSYRVYVEVQRLDARGRDRGRPQRLGDGCRNVGAPELAVNGRGQAILAWLEIPSGSKKRLVVATGSTTGRLRARWNSGAGDAAGHAVALNERGGAIVAYRRGSRMVARVRRAKGFGGTQDLGATPQAVAPGTAVAIDETGAATVAWTDACACGEAGMTAAPNRLRAIRSDDAGRFSGEAQVLDAGQDVPRRPQVAAGEGISAVAWATENGLEGTLVAVSPPHTGFGAPSRFAAGGLLAVDEGVPTLVAGSSAWRWAAGAWSQPEPVPVAGSARALVTDRDGRLALVTQDRGRLRVSYR